MNSPEPTLFLVPKLRSGEPELETAARGELAAHLGRTLTDQEWRSVRTNLLMFFKILRAWDQSGKTDEWIGGDVAATGLDYPKAA